MKLTAFNMRGMERDAQHGDESHKSRLLVKRANSSHPIVPDVTLLHVQIFFFPHVN